MDTFVHLLAPLTALRVHRQVNKRCLTQWDRPWLVLLSSRVKSGKSALLIFEPNTFLSWNRQGSRLFWKFKSRDKPDRTRGLQRIPERLNSVPDELGKAKMIAFLVLHGLHLDYRLVALPQGEK